MIRLVTCDANQNRLSYDGENTTEQSQLPATAQIVLEDPSALKPGDLNRHYEEDQMPDLPAEPDPPEDDGPEITTEGDVMQSWNQDNHQDSTPEQDSHMIGIKEDG